MSLLTSLLPQLAAATVAICLASLAAIYPDSYIGARSERTLPGPLTLPLLGNTLEILWNSRHMLRWFGECQSKYGECFTFSMPSWGRVVVINVPQWLEVMRKGDNVKFGKGEAALSIFREFPGYSAFGTEGKDWRLTRRIQAPIYQLKTVNSHVVHTLATILPITKELLKSVSNQKLVIDWNDFAGRLALDIFCRSALSIDARIITADPGCLSAQIPLMDAVATLNKISGSRLYNPCWRITEWFDGQRRSFNHSRECVFTLIDKIVQERVEASSGDKARLGSDFLGGLLQASEATSNPILIRDTVMTLLFAGRDNVQNALAWSLSELFKAPEWVSRLRKEAISLHSNGGAVHYDEISSYHVHLAVVYETLRLWPGVPKNARLVLEDTILPAIPEWGFNETLVKKGDYLIWSDYDMMRNKKVWGEDAGSFNPGRHLNDQQQFIRPAMPNFHTFGGGPRLCPGAQLAIYELVCIIAGLLRDFDIKPAGIEEMEYVDAYTMSMKGPFPVEIRLGETEPLSGPRVHIGAHYAK